MYLRDIAKVAAAPPNRPVSRAACTCEFTAWTLGDKRKRMASLSYRAVTLFSIAFGVEEAIIVLYLRALASAPVHDRTIVNATVPADTYGLEIIRELCTLVVLGAVAWIAASSPEGRLRAFLLALGAWDIVYYVALWIFSGSPSITSYDVLFLIPIPWIAPVWAVMAFAVALVLLGTCGIAPRGRLALVPGLLLGLISFVYQPIAAIMAGKTDVVGTVFGAHSYPVWLFALALGCVLFSVRFTVRLRFF